MTAATSTPGACGSAKKSLPSARATISAELLAAIRDGIDHVRRFNEQVVARGDWSFESEPGLTVGEKITPIASAGLFVPSGKASYPSVMVQLGTPAVVAGVPSIAVVVPPVPGSSGVVDPAGLVVADELGIRDVFRANGPAGIAALAFGTETVPKVRKVVGPGSPAVTCAQVEVQRYGTVTTMLLGPSESLVIADDSADPRLLAADLLNEAEHGPDSSSWLVTDSEALISAAQVEVARQLAELPEPRRSYAALALGTNGGAILVDDMDQAAEVANAYAPEHMQIAVRDEEAVLARLTDAGEILVGQWTPVSAANFIIGCPASLPDKRVCQGQRGHHGRGLPQADGGGARRRALPGPHARLDNRVHPARGLSCARGGRAHQVLLNAGSALVPALLRRGDAEAAAREVSAALAGHVRPRGQSRPVHPGRVQPQLGERPCPDRGRHDLFLQVPPGRG